MSTPNLYVYIQFLRLHRIFHVDVEFLSSRQIFHVDKDYDSKWDRFLPHQLLNVDQSPLPFAFDSKRTYDIVEKGNGHHHNTWIAQPAGSDLDKRQCTLQVCMRPEGKQPPIAIIFRGKGKRISDDEKRAWHPEVKVYFEENAWADGNFRVL